MAAAINAADPETMRMIGEIWTYAEFTRAAGASPPRPRRANGRAGCGRRPPAPLHALRATLPLWFPRVNEILRLIGSHNVSGGADCRRRLADPGPAAADRPATCPAPRACAGPRSASASFRLAWDFAGSALASRNEQYERFYLASSPRNLARHLALHRPQPRRPAGATFPRRGVLKRR